MKIFCFIRKIALIVAITLGAALFIYHQYSSTPRYLYKIVSDDTYKKSFVKDKLELPELDKVFIHLATKTQVPQIIEKFFKDEKNLHVLKIDVTRLPGRLVKEKNQGGSIEYYHLYDGEILKAAIVGEE